MIIYLDVDKYYFKFNWIKDDRNFCLMNKTVDISTKKVIETKFFTPLKLKIKIYPKEVFSKICVIDSNKNGLSEKQILNNTYIYVYETNGIKYIKKEKYIKDNIEYTIYTMDSDEMLKAVKNELKNNFRNYIQIFNILNKKLL